MCFQSSDLHWALFSALVGNKPQFVSLLLENGVSLKDFLQNEDTLCELYKQLPAGFFLRKLAKRVHSSCRRRGKVFGIRSRVHAGRGENITLRHVSDEVRHLLGGFTKPIYPPSPLTYHFDMSVDDVESVSFHHTHTHTRHDRIKTLRLCLTYSVEFHLFSIRNVYFTVLLGEKIHETDIRKSKVQSKLEFAVKNPHIQYNT